MLKGIIVACACALALPVQARAAAMRRSANDVSTTPAPREALPQQVMEVESRRSAGSIILTDAIGGAALGALAGGGVAAYRNYVQNEGWGNWERDVLIGDGVGLGVGLIVGVADASSNADRPYAHGPYSDERQTGFNSPMPVYGARF